MFGITTLPLGIKYPSNTMSSVGTCGRPIGATAPHRRTSRTSAFVYGRRSRSSKVGNLSVPTMVSISAWALAKTSGWRSIARKKDCIAETVVSAPPVYKLLALHLITKSSCALIPSAVLPVRPVDDTEESANGEEAESESFSARVWAFSRRAETYDGEAVPSA